MDNDITILLADDHTLVRDMLARLLAKEVGISIIGAVSNANETLPLVEQHTPDVVVMDIEMDGMNAFDAARRIASVSPATRVLFLSGHLLDRYIEQVLALDNAGGYVLKSESPADVTRAIREIARGGTFCSREVMSRLVHGADGLRLADSRQMRSSTLTPRELDVLYYIVRGLPQKEIARQLEINHKTVSTHCMNVMNKLDIHDRVELARYAIREGLVTP